MHLSTSNYHNHHLLHTLKIADICSFMKMLFHPATERGHANHGWLFARHSFSFASWHNPEKVHFGALRVLNHDIVAPGMGFGTHPHDNMEIITIPLRGALEHKDSMGNTSVIHAGEVQVMSAGKGIYHSEFNPDANAATELLQIWVFPNQQEVEPRYQQIQYDPELPGLQCILQPTPAENKVWIHQNAWFSIAKIEEGATLNYALNDNKNGVYAFVLSGTFKFQEQILTEFDAVGIENTDQFDIANTENKTGKILFLEIPMHW